MTLGGMDFGSIFKDVEDIFGSFFGELRFWPQPPKHLPLRILGLSGDPWPNEIKSAYHAKLLAAHPDLRPAFDNPEYQEMAQKGRGDLPDIQELVWTRDCALRQAPRPKPVTDNGNPHGEETINVTPTIALRKSSKLFEAKIGEPEICCYCGGELKPPIRIRKRWKRQRFICDSCAEENGLKWDRCLNCGVLMSRRNHQKAKYCCYECKATSKAKLKRERRLRQRTNRVCPECGKKFTPRRGDAKYCSPACRQRAHRKRLSHVR